MNKIILTIGPMFSGKSSLMRKTLISKKNKEPNSKIICITYNKCNLITHKNKKIDIPGITMMKTSELPDLSSYDYIFIDEYQFFDNLYDCIQTLTNKKIYLYGLDMTYEANNWPVYNNILNLKIKRRYKLSGQCNNCTKLSEYSFLKTKITNDNDFVPKINYEYIPLCSTCYNKLNQFI